MECVLHIGCEKTGSTSIQAMLAEQSEHLLRERTLAVTSAGFPNAIHLALASLSLESNDHGFSRLGIGDSQRRRKKWSASIWESIAKEVASGRTSADRIIFSSEYLQSKLTTTSEIKDLEARLLGSGVSRVRVVVYVRRQVDVALSRFSTALKAGYAEIEELPRLGTAMVFYDYASMLDRWEAVFGREAIAVRSYESAHATYDGVIGDFLSLLNIELPCQADVDKVLRSNVSLSGDALRVLKTLNETLAKDGYSREQSAKLRRVILPLLEQDAGSDRLLPSREKARAFQDQFQVANRRMAEKWFDGREVFSSDFGEFPESPSGSKHAAELMLMARVVSRLNAFI